MNKRPGLPFALSALLLAACTVEPLDEESLADVEAGIENECSSVSDCEQLYPNLDVAACNPTNGACRCWDASGSKVRCDALDDGGGSGGSTNYRIAYSADGNQHDYDDLHASPMTLALLHRAGLESKLVHFDYNNHLGDNNSTMASKQKTNVNKAIELFGYDSDLFFDDQSQLSAAVDSLAAAVDASSSSNRLMLICAGPMEVCWRGIDEASDDKEQYVTVISHSSWNDKHEDTSQLNHTWSDIKADFDVLAHHINDQNPPAFNESCNQWTWLKNIPSYGQDLYDLVCVTPSQKAGDASDAGMTYYVIKKGAITSGTSGTSSPSMGDIKSFFGQ